MKHGRREWRRFCGIAPLIAGPRGGAGAKIAPHAVSQHTDEAPRGRDILEARQTEAGRGSMMEPRWMLKEGRRSVGVCMQGEITR